MSNLYKRPVLLIIRDGWGENHNKDHDAFNAIKLAKTPVCDGLSKNWPRTEIIACGLDVGLPEGVMGNSEVGHQNIGSGRVVNQEIVRIDKALESGELTQNPVLQETFKHVQEKGAKLHFIGLVSDAGVHSKLDHLYGLMALAKEAGVEQIFIHAFTDGRDTPPKSGLGYIQEIEKQCKAIGIGKIASVFFNDYREESFAGEERKLIPSPRDVPTYDLKPEMSAYGVCETTKEAILSQKYGLVVVNFANTDMVGHTGSLKSAIKATEVVDGCVGELLQALDKVKGAAVITADHGNSDQMWNPKTNTPHTQHTLNPVEVVIYGKDCKSLNLKKTGRLADLALTILKLMELDQPEEMLGNSLID